MAMPTPTPASTPDYTNELPPDPSQNGTLATAGWANLQTSPPWWNFDRQTLEAVPAALRVILPSGSNPTVTRVSPQSYTATIHVGDTLQLTPGMADGAQNQTSPVAPNSFNGWVYTSRNTSVATINSSGLISGKSRGEVTVLIGSARQTNLPFTNAAPPSGILGCEIFCELNLRILA